MRLVDFEISGFKSSTKMAKVFFSEENVTVIYGDNGCGKTTFLKAINLFLAQDDVGLASLGINSIRCTVIDNSKTYRIIVDKHEDGYGWGAFDESPLAKSSSLSLGVERGVSTQTMKIEPEFLFEFFMHSKQASMLGLDRAISPTMQRARWSELAEELSIFLRRRQLSRARSRRPELELEKSHLYLQSIKIENIEELLLRRYRMARFAATKKIQSALFDTLAVAIDIEDKPKRQDPESERDFSDRLMESRDRIKEALDDGEDNNFKNNIVSILESIDDEAELSKVLAHSLLRQLFKNMIDELEVEKLVLSSINLLIDKFNSYLIGGKQLVVNGSEVFIEIDNAKHSLNDLSSGERHILTFLVLVLFEGQNRNFLIIDEPEISLNIKWQRDLMSIFSELLPGTQIIVASHSPALAKRNPGFLSKLSVWRD